MDDSRRRAKLYVQNDAAWDDHGTGIVTASYAETNRGKEMVLVLHSEEDGSVILESTVQPDITYHERQDCLLLWSEEDKYTLALSFQTKEGRQDIVEKINDAQQNSVQYLIGLQDDEDGDVSLQSMQDLSSIELPPCELSKLEEISDTLTNIIGLPCLQDGRRPSADRLALMLEESNYVAQLMELFHVCEDLENVDGLYHLYDIVKSLFLLNQASIVQLLLGEEILFDIVGCLEYDRRQSERTNHRTFLTDHAEMKEVISIKDPAIKSKIQMIYRAQYIQDILMPMPLVFEENMLSSLHAVIIFAKSDVITALQNDEAFLTELFQSLQDDSTSMERATELMLFLKEYDQFTDPMTAEDRLAVYRTLIPYGFFNVLSIFLALDDGGEAQKAAVSILRHVSEFSPALVREACLDAASPSNEDEDQLLLNVIIDRMVEDCDGDISGCLSIVLKVVLGLPPSMQQNREDQLELSLPLKEPNPAMVAAYNEFLAMFYRQSMHHLMAPLLASTSGKRMSRDDSRAAGLLRLIMDVLCVCVTAHTYHIRNHIISRDLLRRVLVLTQSVHKHLALSAVRFVRQVLGQKDDALNNYIIRNDHLRPIVELLEKNRNYNLTNSACVELFEFVCAEVMKEMKEMALYIAENYKSTLEKITYVSTFHRLLLRTEQEKDRQALMQDTAGNSTNDISSMTNQSRYGRDGSMDDAEEMWFNDDEDTLFDDDTSNGERHTSPATHHATSPISSPVDNAVDGRTADGPTSPPTNSSNSNSSNSSSPPLLKSLRKNDDDEDDVADVFKNPIPRTSRKRSFALVDYDEEEDEDDDDDDGEKSDVNNSTSNSSSPSLESPAKRRKVDTTA
ncbi:serine/threonine-protein phosphatase 4 regulatory subunit 3-like [Sycon ciliatum]|uniref:serine/threonine-protein phosphatase 4 regulatory subunit 3-like n=1 Tax=Sycon ciliatum TaxID=27933 RepID=UPI0031F6B14C